MLESPKKVLLVYLANNLENPAFDIFNIKQPDVANATGLSQQLISYHFKQLIAHGAIGKVGNRFYVANKQMIIDSALSTKESKPIRLPKAISFFNVGLLDLTRVVKAMQTARVKGSLPVAELLEEKLDAIILELQETKRWLRLANSSKADALALLGEVDLEELYWASPVLQTAYSTAEDFNDHLVEIGVSTKGKTRVGDLWSKLEQPPKQPTTKQQTLSVVQPEKPEEEPGETLAGNGQ